MNRSPRRRRRTVAGWARTGGGGAATDHEKVDLVTLLVEVEEGNVASHRTCCTF